MFIETETYDRMITAMLLLYFLLAVVSAKVPAHYEDEVRDIINRTAEAGSYFEDHDVAHVYILDDRGRVQERWSNPGELTDSSEHQRRHILLRLSMGSQVRFVLNPANIDGSGTKVTYRTKTGRSEGGYLSTDCYFHGEIIDESNKTRGPAALSLCNGMFGFGHMQGYEYFFHPIISKRSKRDTHTSDYNVHIMRRSIEPRFPDDAFSSQVLSQPKGKTKPISSEIGREEANSRRKRNAEVSFGFAKVVVEIGMFSDAQYTNQLRLRYPGRENDFLLTMLAGTQALYSNPHKTGYELSLKVKLLEFWDENPSNYTFQQNFVENLQSFCEYTTKIYSYDVHALNSGITDWLDGVRGFANVGSACTSNRCLITRGMSIDNFAGLAHEIGHTLGMTHKASNDCEGSENYSGGFMGSGARYDFSKCMNAQLAKTVEDEKYACLSQETSISKTGSEFSNLLSVLPGQTMTPDSLCQLLSGPSYNYVAPETIGGARICKLFVCLNENRTAPEFGRAVRSNAPIGFPCAREAFCNGKGTCTLWRNANWVFETETLRMLSVSPASQWSEWSDVSGCSRTCGTGVKLRRRQCQYAGLNLVPYCPGLSIEPMLCSTDPCRGDPASRNGLRQRRGDEVCEKFVSGTVPLHLKSAVDYDSKSAALTNFDVSGNLHFIGSPSCMLKCKRVPFNAVGDLDAFMPDGTPCNNLKRSWYELDRLNITPRCVRGTCYEFTDCPDHVSVKDACGICGGDGTRCVTLTFNRIGHIKRSQRLFLAEIPEGSVNIDLRINQSRNRRVIPELWSNDSQHSIIGKGGHFEYDDYGNYFTVEFAGTIWQYDKRSAYLRSAGPTLKSIQLKALRRSYPMKYILVRYAKKAYNNVID